MSCHVPCSRQTDSCQRLADARLYVLLDGGDDLAQFERQVNAVVEAVDVIQLRDKRLSDRELLERASVLRQRTRESGIQLIVNDRPDLAVVARADGVHLGQEDLSVRDARRLVGTSALIGVSTHDIEQARQAVLDGADYLGCGPTFPSRTKQFDRFPGLAFLEQVQAEIRLPCFAIGGIDENNLRQVLATGFQRIVVGGCLNGADASSKAARLHDALHSIGDRGAVQDDELRS